MASQKDLAEHLDLSDRTVRDLITRGIFPKNPRGSVDLDDCRVAYIRHLRERAAGRGSDAAEAEGLDLTAERARLAKLQADNVEMKNAILRKDLVTKSDITLAMSGVIRLVAGNLQRVHKKLRGVDNETRKAVASLIEETLSELSVARVEEALVYDPEVDEIGDVDDA